METAVMVAGQHPPEKSPQQVSAAVMERVLLGGDLAGLTPQQRADYYNAVCQSLGLNPLTKPFEYLNLNGKLRLYALRDCADQLRKLHGISIYIVGRDRLQDVYIVTARAKDRTGREDESTGVVNIGGLKGEALANALMKAETKSKRRVTLSIAGLGWLDEVEVDTGTRTHEQMIPAGTVVTAADVARFGGNATAAALAKAQINDPARPTAEQVDGLVSLASSLGLFGPEFARVVRHVLILPNEQPISRKFLRESISLADFDKLWEHFQGLFTAPQEPMVDDDQSSGDMPIEAEVSPGLAGDRATTGESEPVQGEFATPQQIASLKRLATQVGEDAVADVQDMLEHSTDIPYEVYVSVKSRLEQRKAAKTAEPA